MTKSNSSERRDFALVPLKLAQYHEADSAHLKKPRVFEVENYFELHKNPYFSAQRVRPGHEKVSMVRVPTRCPLCKKAWAVEVQDDNKQAPGYLDQSVYKNIPMVKGVCHKCKS